MGYTTEFEGSFRLDRPLRPEQVQYLQQFNGTRRMSRDAKIAASLPDPLRQAVGLPIGENGGYFVGGTGMAGQDDDASVVDYNSPPSEQPSLWCQWRPTDDGTAIEWDGGEKFYDYAEWLCFIIVHFLAPWGYVLDGEVKWSGEEEEDAGILRVRNNEVSISPAHDDADAAH